MVLSAAGALGAGVLDLGRNSLLKPVADDLSLASALLVWFLVVAWLWRKGWRVQRRYFIEATLTPYKRNGIVWTSAIIGIITIVASHLRSSAPAIVAVAMIGALSALTDARTHRLPNAYTAAMGLGVAFGAGCAVAASDEPWRVLAAIGAGLLIWLVPLWLLSRLPGGVGFGDVKIAPVLGAMLGSESVEAAIGGLVISFLAAGLAAVWRIVVGSAGTQARMPLGPWLILGAAVSHVVWGVVPDWF